MAMNGNTMGSAVYAAIAAALADTAGNAENPGIMEGEALWQLICTQIVSHITANGHATGTDSRGDTHNLDLE